MSIDSIGAGSLPSLSQIQINQPLLQSAGVASAGDSDASVSKTSGGHHRHGGGMMKSVMEALGQSGVNTGDQSSPGSDVSQAMHAFMHALFGAMQSVGGSEASGAAESNPVSGVNTPADGTNDSGGSARAGSVASGYRSPSTTLQSVIRALGSGQGSSSSTAVADLQNAFQNLLTAMNGNAQKANGSSPTLQSFLQNLVPDLNNQQSLRSAAVGSLANMSA